jgi:hypothetical protein
MGRIAAMRSIRLTLWKSQGPLADTGPSVVCMQRRKATIPKRVCCTLSRKKMGFSTPIATMFQHNLSGYLKDLLLSSRCLNRGYFQRGAINRLIQEHVEKKTDHHKLLWQLVVLIRRESLLDS